MEHWLSAILFKFTYVALVAILAAAGVGVPISEDLTLLLGGALAAKGVTSFWPTLFAGYGGVLLGDVLIHRWGARLGPRAYLVGWVRKVFSLERQAQLRRHFARHGALTVVVGRHTPGLRAAIFFLAGASGVPAWKFALADAFSAAITVPAVVWLGFYFAAHLDEVRARIHHVEWVLGGVALLAVLVWALLRRRARSRTAGRL